MVRVRILRVEENGVAKRGFGVVPAPAKDVHASHRNVDGGPRVVEGQGPLSTRHSAIDRVAHGYVPAAPHDHPAIGEPGPRLDRMGIARGRGREIHDRTLDRRARALMPEMPSPRNYGGGLGIDYTRPRPV